MRPWHLTKPVLLYSSQSTLYKQTRSCPVTAACYGAEWSGTHSEVPLHSALYPVAVASQLALFVDPRLSINVPVPLNLAPLHSARHPGAALGGLKPVHSNGTCTGITWRCSSPGSNWAIALGLCHNSNGDLMQLHSPGSHSPPHSSGGYPCLPVSWAAALRRGKHHIDQVHFCVFCRS